MKFNQDLCLNLQYDFGKMNLTLGSVVPLAMFLCPKAKRAWPLGPHLVSAEEAVTTILPWWQLKEGPKRSSRHGNDKKLDHLRPWQKLRWRLGWGRLGGQEESTSAQCPTLLCKEPYSARKKLCSEEKLCSTGELCCGGWWLVVGAHKCYKWMAGGSEGLGRPPLENCNKSTRRESRCERSRVTTISSNRQRRVGIEN